MWKTTKLLPLGSLLLVCGFALGVAHLFVLRFQAGDVYPAYSSMRADPLGTKVLYESLRETGRVAVGRNFEPLTRLAAAQSTTLFCLAASPSSAVFLSPDFFQRLNELAVNGARVVMAVRRPWGAADAQRDECESEDAAQGRNPQDRSRLAVRKVAQEKATPAGSWNPIAALKSKWRLTVACDRLRAGPPGADLNPESAAAGLPLRIPWHSTCYFADLSPAWQVIYAAGDRPVLIERSFGRGTLVLMTDAYLLSNEALRDERRPGLLAWLAGPQSKVLFEETHLGLRTTPGAAALIRRTRLHWPVAAAVVLALLLVWKSAAPFVPPPPEEDAAGTGRVVSEKDYTEGLISLLRRNIAASRILETMVAQWQKDLPRSRPVSEARRERIRAQLAGGPSLRSKTDPVSGYRAIYKLISEKSNEE